MKKESTGPFALYHHRHWRVISVVRSPSFGALACAEKRTTNHSTFNLSENWRFYCDFPIKWCAGKSGPEHFCLCEEKDFFALVCYRVGCDNKYVPGNDLLLPEEKWSMSRFSQCKWWPRFREKGFIALESCQPNSWNNWNLCENPQNWANSKRVEMFVT